MRRCLAFGLPLFLGCGDKAKNLFHTAQLEEKQNNVGLSAVDKPPDGHMFGNARNFLAQAT